MVAIKDMAVSQAASEHVLLTKKTYWLARGYDANPSQEITDTTILTSAAAYLSRLLILASWCEAICAARAAQKRLDRDNTVNALLFQTETR